MGSPDGSSSLQMEQTLNQNELEEPGPQWSNHAAAVLNRTLI